MSVLSSRWRGMFALSMIALAAFVAAGCGSSGDDGTSTSGATGAKAAEQVLHLNLGGEPEYLDPGLATDTISFNTALAIFSGLTKIVGDDQEVVGEMAESWELSDDGKTYTFTLRDDIRWSDGTPITADDFVWAWLRNLDPKTAAEYAYSMWDIVGAQEYNSGEGKASGVGVKAIDEKTLEVKLKNPVPWFDQLVSTMIFMPLPKKAIQAHGDKWTEAENIVTNGPFTLEEWDHERSLTFVKNDDYWDADNVTLETVDAQIITNRQTAYAKYQSGELDAGFQGSMVSPEDFDSAAQEEGFYSRPILATQYLGFNIANVKSAEIRKGISKAINRRSIIDNVVKGGRNPAGTFTPPGIPGYETISQGGGDYIDPENADIEGAKELLEEGGWKEGDELSLYFTTEGANAQDVATAITSDLEKVGIKVRLKAIPQFSTFLKVLGPPADKDIDMYLLGWQADYADAHNFLNLLTSASGNNNGGYKNPEFDKAVADAAVEQDAAARFDLEREAEAMLTGPEGDHPVAPLYSDSNVTLVQPYVEGFAYTPMGLLYLSEIEILEH